MQRLGTLLMIIGANLIAGAIGMGIYLANMACVMSSTSCTKGLIALFVDLMSSSDGIGFWLVIVVGMVTLWQGKRIRARE